MKQFVLWNFVFVGIALIFSYTAFNLIPWLATQPPVVTFTALGISLVWFTALVRLFIK